MSESYANYDECEAASLDPKAVDRIAALEDAARVKDEALRPFALADFFCADDPDDRVVSIGRWDNSFGLPRFYADMQITVGDLRRARTALASGREGGDG